MVWFSIILLVVLALVIFIFIKKDRNNDVFIVLPVSAMPIGYLLATFILFISKNQFFNFKTNTVTLFIIWLALTVSCGLTIFGMSKIETPKRQKGYVIGMLAYILVIGWIYIYNII